MLSVFHNPEPGRWAELLRRPADNRSEIETRVRPILADVKEQGDAALAKYTRLFDQIHPETFRVSEAELAQAESLIEPRLAEAIRSARKNIQKFHLAQREVSERIETQPGVWCWRKSLPIERVGLYVPGGSAPLFSTVLMLGVPALVAGCAQVVLCTPPGAEGKVHPATLFAAHLVGIKDVFAVGGAQAIAAMAYGTETIPSVYKIFGPGNQYVTAAKQVVQNEGIAIDMPAGPSEVLVVADSGAHPDHVAADLLSQAEHGPDSQVILVTTEATVVEAVQAALSRLLETLPRAELARQALTHSKAFVMPDATQALALVNAYAPEHLILSVAEPEVWAEQVVNAGSVFLGYYTPESAGDYASGTNHTLPTSGYARVYAGVSLDSFVRKVTFQHISAEGLKGLGPIIETMAEAEGLAAHALAVSLRTQA